MSDISQISTLVKMKVDIKYELESAGISNIIWSFAKRDIEYGLGGETLRFARPRFSGPVFPSGGGELRFARILLNQLSLLGEENGRFAQVLLNQFSLPERKFDRSPGQTHLCSIWLGFQRMAKNEGENGMTGENDGPLLHSTRKIAGHAKPTPCADFSTP